MGNFLIWNVSTLLRTDKLRNNYSRNRHYRYTGDRDFELTQTWKR